MKIIHKFKLIKNKQLFLFSKTSDQEYTKSYLKNNTFTFDFISEEEYIAELANFILFDKQLNSNV